MDKQNFYRRVVFPILPVLITMVVSMNFHDLTRSIENRALHTIAVFITAGLMFLSIWLGAMLADTIAYFRGASFGERLFVSLFTPVVWGIKTWSCGLGIFSAPEMAFLAFHHIILGAPVVSLICFGLAEIWCRAIHRRRERTRPIQVLAAGSLAPLIAGVCLTTLMLWNGGHWYYYHYMKLYTSLFLN